MLMKRLDHSTVSCVDVKIVVIMNLCTQMIFCVCVCVVVVKIGKLLQKFLFWYIRISMLSFSLVSP